MACDCITVETTPEVVSIETTTLDEVIEVGVVGPQGATGATGATGVGVPTGGITGYILAKKTSADYDTEWIARTPISHAASHAAAGSDPVFDQDLNTANSPTFNQLTLTPSQSDSSLKLGTLEFQGYALNNAWIGDNVYFDGANFLRRASGAATLFYFQGDEGQFRCDVSDEAGTDVTSSPAFKVGAGGKFSAGANVSNQGNFEEGMLYSDGNNIGFSDKTDNTKKATLDLSGITTETTRNLSLPDAGGTLALTQQATDYEVTDETKGVIMKSPNGTRWRVTIDNNGSLLRTAIALLLSAFLVCGAKAQVRDLVYGTNNVVIGPTNTNALSFTNRVSLPISSGAATTNSTLQADGAGGSAFVASQTQTVAMTNSAFRTNTTDTSTNNAQSGMVLNLDANSTYRFAYAFIITSSTTGGFGATLRHSATTNGLRSTYVGRQGRPINVSAIDITASSSLGTISLQSVNFAATNIVTTGTGILATGTASGTLTLCWHQNTATNVASELVAGSMMTVTKISP